MKFDGMTVPPHMIMRPSQGVFRATLRAAIEALCGVMHEKLLADELRLTHRRNLVPLTSFTSTPGMTIFARVSRAISGASVSRRAAL